MFGPWTACRIVEVAEDLSWALFAYSGAAAAGNPEHLYQVMIWEQPAVRYVHGNCACQGLLKVLQVLEIVFLALRTWQRHYLAIAVTLMFI